MPHVCYLISNSIMINLLVPINILTKINNSSNPSTMHGPCLERL